jgi:hypothetical protein
MVNAYLAPRPVAVRVLTLEIHWCLLHNINIPGSYFGRQPVTER